MRVRSGVQLYFCSGRQLTPFGQRNRAVQLEIVAIGEMAVEIEVVTDGGVDGGARRCQARIRSPACPTPAIQTGNAEPIESAPLSIFPLAATKRTQIAESLEGVKGAPDAAPDRPLPARPRRVTGCNDLSRTIRSAADCGRSMIRGALERWVSAGFPHPSAIRRGDRPLRSTVRDRIERRAAANVNYL